VYHLDAINVFNNRLVKKIEVKGVKQVGTTSTIVIFTSISCQRRKAGHHVPISTLTLQIRQVCAFNPAKLGNHKAIFHLLYTYIEKKMSICFVVKEIILNFALAFNKEAG